MPADPTPDAPPHRRQRQEFVRVFVIVCAFLTCVQVNRLGGGAIANALIDQRGLAPAEIGGIIGAMSLAAAAVQIPLGMMFDRFGARLTTSFLSMIAVAGIFIFAFAESALGLTSGRVLIGIGHAGAVTTGYLLVLGWTAPDRVATVSARVIALSGGLGGVLATAPLAIMLEWLGLTPTFVLLALAIFALTLMIYFFVTDRPSHLPAPVRPKETLGQAIGAIFAMARDKDIRGTLIMASCFAAPFSTVGGLWAGPYFRDVYGLDQSEAGYVLLAMALAVNFGTFFYGPLDRTFGTRKWVVLASAGAMILLLGVLAALPAPPLWLALALLVGFSVVSPFFVVLAAHCRSFVPDHLAGRAITGMSLVGVGNIFFLQWATGLVVDATRAPTGETTADGYRLVFAAVALTILAAALVYMRVRDMPPQRG